MRFLDHQLPLFPERTPEPDPVTGFSVRESSRAKRLSIKVFPRGKVEVVVPRRTRPQDVRSFVEENQAWIENARTKFAIDHVQEPFALPELIELKSINRVTKVEYLAEKGSRTVKFRASGDKLVLKGAIQDEKLCVAALRRWLTSVARREFEPKLRALAVQTEAPFSKLQIRCQRTCWGSRSSSGTLSLNLCLLFLAPELTRYLMVHELCHGRHMNHSKRFWRLVGKYEPEYRVLDRRLGESWRDIPVWLGVY